jgi:hypothetical protein
VVRQAEAVKAGGRGSAVVGGAAWGGATTGCEGRRWPLVAQGMGLIWANGPQLLAPETASATVPRIVPSQACWLLASCPATVPDPVLGRLLHSRLVAWGLLAWHE